jgi:hypothetical protein
MKFTDQIRILVAPEFTHSPEDLFWVQYTPGCVFFVEEYWETDERPFIGTWVAFKLREPDVVLSWNDNPHKNNFLIVKTRLTVTFADKDYPIFRRIG